MEAVWLVHWNPAEGDERARVLRASGYEVIVAAPQGIRGLREVWADPPLAVVIDLDRLPMQGRDVGLQLRHRRATSGVPLVFVGGLPEKVSRVREALPDADYTSWSAVVPSLRSAIARPRTVGVVRGSNFDVYAQTPLQRKLGIKAGQRLAVINAPPGFTETLGALPEDVVVSTEAGGQDLAVWFVRSRNQLEERVEVVAASVQRGGLWIAWPKKSARHATDLNHDVVQAAGLASGLVDYKICSIDETWSGLLFSRRRDRTRRPSN